MNVIDTKIADVKIIEPKVFEDERGFFMESWNERDFLDAGIGVNFVQDNHSRSVKNTLRGLHYQVKKPQGKLVRVSRGEIFDVAVDLRPDSATFGQWVGEYLSEFNCRMLWIPQGFAHGFIVKSDMADLHYKCTDYYAPEYERSIRWNDETLNINWKINNQDELLLSEKDKNAHGFEQLN